MTDIGKPLREYTQTPDVSPAPLYVPEQFPSEAPAEPAPAEPVEVPELIPA